MAIIKITATGLADDATALNDLTYKIYNGATDAFIVAKGSHTSDADVTVTGTTVVINNVNIGALGIGDTVKVTAVDDDGVPLEGDLSATFTVTVGDVTAPTLVSATIEDASPTDMVMVFSEIVTGTNLGFTIAGTTSTVFASISGSGTTTITGVLATAAANGETITLAYDSAVGDIVDAASNDLATFGATGVTNNIAAAGYVMITDSLATDTDLTFAAGTPNQWSADLANGWGVVTAQYTGAFDVKAFVQENLNKDFGIGIDDDNTNANPATWIAEAHVSELKELFINNTGSPDVTGVTATVNAATYIRLTRVSAAADILFYYSNAGGAEQLIHTFTGNAAATYIKFVIGGITRIISDLQAQ